MKKKKLFFFLFLFSIVSLFASEGKDLKKPLKQKLSDSLYEQVTDTTDPSNEKVKITTLTNKMFPDPFNKQNKSLLDIPLTQSLHSFAAIVNEVGNIVVHLCMLCCFLCIIFNCFKLWFSTTEVKKFFVDIIWKLIICIILLFCYIPFTNSLVSFASQIAVSICGGYDKINSTYVRAHATLEKAIGEGLEDITKLMYENAIDGHDGNKYITDKMIEDLKACQMSQEQIDEWVKKHNLKIASPVIVQDVVGSGNTNQTKEEVWGYTDGNGKVLKSKGWFFTSIDGFSSKVNKTTKKYKDKKDTQLSYVSKIIGLQQVLTGESVEPKDLDKNVSQQTKEKKEKSLKVLKNVYYSPFLVNKDGNNTPFLSASKLLKTITVMNDAVYYANGLQIDPNTNDWQERKIKWTFNGLVDFLESLLQKFGMLICCAIIMAEYILTILEFYLIRGLATLLIPFYFLDATKSYAENLIKIFFNYFFKILITIFVCFFSLGMFLEIILIGFVTEKESFYIVLFLVTLAIGTMFCSKIPNILSTLLSGNPSMGFGNVMETARGAAHGMHMAQHAVQSAGKIAGGLVKGVQGGGRFVANAGATLDGMANASNAAKSSAISWNNKQTSDGSKISVGLAGFKGAMSYLGESTKQHAKDSAFSLFTGQKAARNGTSNVFTKLGQTYVDGEGHQKTMSMSNIKEENAKAGENIGKNAVAKMTGSIKKGGMSTVEGDEQGNNKSSGTQKFGETEVREGIGPSDK